MPRFRLPSPIFGAALLALLSCQPSAELVEDPLRELVEDPLRLAEEVFLETHAVGWIQEIHLGECHPSPGNEVVVVGPRGALVLDLEGRELAGVRFKWNISRPEVVDVTGDGTCEFLDRGSGWSSSGLTGADGEAIWCADGEGADGDELWCRDDVTGIDNIAAGDLDGDGILEFVVGFNGGDGVRRYDHTGRLTWRAPDDSNVWHVEIVDVDGDGRREIVHTNGAEIRIRDAQGEILATNQPRGASVYGFSILETGTPERRPRLLFATYLFSKKLNQVWIADFDGTPIRRFATPYDHPFRLHNFRGTTVRFQDDGPVFVALLFHMKLEQPNSSWSVLQLHDEKNAVVFRKTWRKMGYCQDVVAVPALDGTHERLLVGCVGHVWEFSIAEPTRAEPTRPRSHVEAPSPLP